MRDSSYKPHFTVVDRKADTVTVTGFSRVMTIVGSGTVAGEAIVQILIDPLNLGDRRLASEAGRWLTFWDPEATFYYEPICASTQAGGLIGAWVADVNVPFDASGSVGSCAGQMEIVSSSTGVGTCQFAFKGTFPCPIAKGKYFIDASALEAKAEPYMCEAGQFVLLDNSGVSAGSVVLGNLYVKYKFRFANSAVAMSVAGSECFCTATAPAFSNVLQGTFASAIQSEDVVQGTGVDSSLTTLVVTPVSGGAGNGMAVTPGTVNFQLQNDFTTSSGTNPGDALATVAMVNAEALVVANATVLTSDLMTRVGGVATPATTFTYTGFWSAIVTSLAPVAAEIGAAWLQPYLAVANGAASGLTNDATVFNVVKVATKFLLDYFSILGGEYSGHLAGQSLRILAREAHHFKGLKRHRSRHPRHYAEYFRLHVERRALLDSGKCPCDSCKEKPHVVTSTLNEEYIVATPVKEKEMKEVKATAAPNPPRRFF